MNIDPNQLISVNLLPVELTNSNDGQGRAFWRSATVRKRIEAKLHGLGYTRIPLRFPVALRITRILGPGQRLWDEDSLLRGNAKQLLDSLVSLGWFEDDKPKHVTRVMASQNAGFRAYGPATLVEVFRTDEREDDDISEALEMAQAKN